MLSPTSLWAALLPLALASTSQRPYYEEGGWRTTVQDILVGPGPCNLPIEDGTRFTNKDFLKKYAYQRPFVVRDASNNNVRAR